MSPIVLYLQIRYRWHFDLNIMYRYCFYGRALRWQVLIPYPLPCCVNKLDLNTSLCLRSPEWSWLKNTTDSDFYAMAALLVLICNKHTRQRYENFSGTRSERQNKSKENLSPIFIRHCRFSCFGPIFINHYSYFHQTLPFFVLRHSRFAISVLGTSLKFSSLFWNGLLL